MSSLPTESQGMHLMSPGTNCDDTGEVLSTPTPIRDAVAKDFIGITHAPLLAHTEKPGPQSKSRCPGYTMCTNSLGTAGHSHHLTKVSYQCENCNHFNSRAPAKGQAREQTFRSTRRLAQVLFPKQHTCMGYTTTLFL